MHLNHHQQGKTHLKKLRKSGGAPPLEGPLAPAPPLSPSPGPSGVGSGDNSSSPVPMGAKQQEGDVVVDDVTKHVEEVGGWVGVGVGGV